jgi:aspartyl-tRNA synthetase
VSSRSDLENDFPLFQKSDDGKYVANHHPFTSPNMDDFKKDPYSARSWAYDIVLNGVEIGGGSIRIHDQEVQQKVFEILDISLDQNITEFESIYRTKYISIFLISMLLYFDAIIF